MGELQPPRGTRDFGPAQMAARRRLEDRMRRVLHAFNFREVQTPTFEDLELFLAKSGPGIVDELYTFKDKSGRDLCLRPELTAPVMRFYFGSLRTEPKPLRLFYFGPCYRYDRPQAGRYREFWQLGTEVIGDASPEVHAELLWLALTLFREAGLRNIRLRIGHVGMLRSILRHLKIAEPDQPPLLRLIDKRETAAIREILAGTIDRSRIDLLLSLFDLSQRVFDLKEDDVRMVVGEPSTWRVLLDDEGRTALAHVTRVGNLLRAFGAEASQFAFDPMIARGLEYYTGLVFELDCPDLGAEKQLLGGGEYDLSGVFGAAAEPTVGFGLGYDRTLVALERAGAPPEVNERVDSLVSPLVREAVPQAIRVANDLRSLDLRVELDLSSKGAKRSLQRAAGMRARLAILLGERELKQGVASVKNLDTGEQVELPLADVGPRALGWIAAVPAATALGGGPSGAT